MTELHDKAMEMLKPFWGTGIPVAFKSFIDIRDSSTAHYINYQYVYLSPIDHNNDWGMTVQANMDRNDQTRKKHDGSRFLLEPMDDYTFRIQSLADGRGKNKNLGK